MQPWLIILIVIAGIALVALVIKLAKAAAERERQRLEGLHRWAAANGFAFSREDPHALDARFHGVFEIGHGHDRYALEVLARRDPLSAFIFRYHFKTWETRTVTYRDSQGNTQTRTETYEETHWRRYLIIELPAMFPSLVIRREGWFDKLAGFVGFDDVDFESEAFSQRYFCKSSDRQFAYAVVHPQMMEWLLSRESFSAQLENHLLLMDLSSTSHEAETCYAAWSAAAGFVNRIPPFAWQDYGKSARVELPEVAAPLPPQPVGTGDKAA